MNKPTKRQIGARVGCLWISGSMLVALDQSSCVNGNGSGYLWISVGSQDQCLWVDEMCFDACGSMLAVEINARRSTESVLVGFDSCGSCGGDWCLWWISGLTMRGNRRRRCLWREVI